MKKILLFLMIMLLFTGCNSDDTSLPDETQEGKGTFGFTLNGNVFNGRSFATNKYAIYSGEKRLDLFRDGYIDSLQSDFDLNIIINHPIEEGQTYLLSSTEDSVFQGDFGKIFYYIKSNKPDEWWGREYYTTTEHTGELTITKLDTDKQIVSGRFWFDVWTEQFGVVKIRDGRFDAKYINNER